MSTGPASPAEVAVLDLLRHGTIEIEGRLVVASNATLFATVTLEGQQEHCVYKPVAGERPLWDFPDGTLAHREVAAYEVSAATGWGVVPPTVWREGPFGPGSVQLWVEEVDQPCLVDVVPVTRVPRGWLSVLRAEDATGGPVELVHADDPRLRRMALLDAVIDNADRKGGHVLVTEQGAVHGVDHGVCFNVEDKLRTVLWGWQGQTLDADSTEVLTRVARSLRADQPDSLGTRLRQHLSAGEIGRTRERAEHLLRTRRFPRPRPHGPTIPWPPF